MSDHALVWSVVSYQPAHSGTWGRLADQPGEPTDYSGNSKMIENVPPSPRNPAVVDAGSVFERGFCSFP